MPETHLCSRFCRACFMYGSRWNPISLLECQTCNDSHNCDIIKTGSIASSPECSLYLQWAWTERIRCLYNNREVDSFHQTLVNLKQCLSITGQIFLLRSIGIQAYFAWSQNKKNLSVSAGRNSEFGNGTSLYDGIGGTDANGWQRCEAKKMFARCI